MQLNSRNGAAYWPKFLGLSEVTSENINWCCLLVLLNCCCYLWQRVDSTTILVNIIYHVLNEPRLALWRGGG